MSTMLETDDPGGSAVLRSYNGVAAWNPSWVLGVMTFSYATVKALPCNEPPKESNRVLKKTNYADKL